MTRIIDLDDLAPADLTVRKKGVEYVLPGDPPIDVWLRLVEAGDAFMAAPGDEGREALETFRDRMLELFRIHQPELTELPFGVPGMYALLAGFYGTNAAPDPPQPRRRGGGAASTTTTSNGSKRSPTKAKAKPKTASRSSS